MVARVGLHKDRLHRYSWGNGAWKPGVTGIVKVQDNYRGADGLINWSVNIAVQAMAEGASIEQAKAEISKARDRGTAVHLGIEAMLTGQPFEASDDTLPYWYGVAKFIHDYRPEIVTTEQMVYSQKFGYGGTLDLIARLHGPLKGLMGMLDYKTGAPKDTHALQLAGYSGADFMGNPDDPKQYDLPEFDGHFVLALMPESPYYDLVPLPVGRDEIVHFHYLADTFHRLRAWDNHEKPSEQLELVAA